MKHFIITILLQIGLLGTNALAADCISQTEMAEIASHFTQFKDLAQKEFCYDGSQTSNLLASMMFMRTNPFASNMKASSDELFTGRFATNWYKYFIGRIDYLDVQSSCPKGVGAYVRGFNNHTMYICPMILSDNFSALDRASVFMHEARHIDGYPHITCSQGPRKGLAGACDDRISEGGSYAVTVETYAQLAKYATNLHPALKAYSLVSAVTFADEAFEVPVRVNREDQLLLMAKSRDLYSLDLNTGHKLKTLGQTPALGRIILRAQHMMLFPDDKSLSARYLFVKNEGELNQAAGDIAVEYNNQNPTEKARLIDVHISAQWSARIYPDKVKFACDPRSPSAEEIAINGTSPVGIFYFNGYNRASYTNYLMTNNGAVYEFGCQNKRAFLRNSTITLDQKYKRIYKVGNTTFALTHDGRVFELNGTQAQPVSTAIDGQIHEIAPRQAYEFLDYDVVKN